MPLKYLFGDILRFKVQIMFETHYFSVATSFKFLSRHSPAFLPPQCYLHSCFSIPPFTLYCPLIYQPINTVLFIWARVTCMPKWTMWKWIESKPTIYTEFACSLVLFDLMHSHIVPSCMKTAIYTNVSLLITSLEVFVANIFRPIVLCRGRVNRWGKYVRHCFEIPF